MTISPPSPPHSVAWARAIALLLILNLILLAMPAFRQPPAEPADPFAAQAVEMLVPSPAPALHVSLWWNEEIANRDMDLVNAMGFRWIKQSFAWRDIETVQKGRFDWWRTDRIIEDIEKHDLRVIIRLDRQPFWSQPDGGTLPLENVPPANYQDFGDFCRAVATRYRGRIDAYQVWNEPNLAREWGNNPPDPAAYVRLLATCYEGIKSADPAALVISAGLAPTGTTLPEALPADEFLHGMYAAGGAAYFDMLGMNAPGYAAPPETPPEVAASTPEYGGHRWNSFRYVEDIRRVMVAEGDAHKQIAVLEMGWTTDPINPAYSWFAVNEEQQAHYLEGAYWYAHQNWYPWIGIMTTIYLPDPYWDRTREEYWWGITFPGWPDAELRPAYHALSGLPDWGSEFYEVETERRLSEGAR